MADREREQFYDEDGNLVPSRLFAEIERLRAVYDAAVIWVRAGNPVTGGTEGRLIAAIDKAERDAKL